MAQSPGSARGDKGCYGVRLTGSIDGLDRESRVLMSTLDPFAGVPGPLRTALERRGFTSLTAVQRAVLAADSQGQNLRISSQTGSGKTVALGLVLARSLLAAREPDDAAEREPAAAREPGAGRPRGPLALVITPTRELAVQVRDELRWLLAEVPGLRIEVVTGGTDVGGERRMLRRPPTILVGTPGRLLDHLRSQALSCAGVEHVVLDEADRMLEMGFRDELEAIIDELPAERRSHLMSATFPALVRRVADRFQGKALHLQGTVLGEANDDIDHVAQLVAQGEGYAALVNALLLALGERVLVFVDRRIDASELAELLANDGFPALPFSGDLGQAQRTRTLQAFRTGTISVLVSTDVAARGIDVPDISMVVHMSTPQDPDAYTHRSGRTGRAGRRGRSLLLVPPRAQRHVTRLLASAGIEADWQPVPTPAKVQKAITKRTRKQLHARLDAEEGPADKTLEYAKQLLEGRDPMKVVAALLEMAEPRLPCEPKAVRELAPVFERGYERGAERGPERTLERTPERGRGPRPMPTERGAGVRAGQATRDGYVRFFVNWGVRGGATPARLLSHVCRRGGIDSQHVGAIDLGPGSATFEVAQEAAAEFEARAREPDARDPGVKIARDDGRRPMARGPRTRRDAPRGPRGARLGTPPHPDGEDRHEQRS
jgi:ATP-dependent RNA helicase DeaD